MSSHSSTQCESKRIFRGGRLTSYAGFLLPPAIHDGLQFFLPQFTPRSSRLVAIGTRLWELWSPNSSVHSYFPGVRNLDAPFPINLSPQHRRCDGNQGRFDSTILAQYYDHNNPHYGFVRRPPIADHVHCIEYHSVLDYWRPSRAPNFGYLNPAFIRDLNARAESCKHNVDGWYQKGFEKRQPSLWQTRPRYDSSDIDALRCEVSFDDVVDLVAKIQRQIKLMCAWSQMANVIDHTPRSLPRVPHANDEFMGVWVNGCTEQQVLWLLDNRVPCFIIHELEEDKEHLRTIGSQKYTDFCQTAITVGIQEHRADSTVVKDGGLLLAVDSDPAIAQIDSQLNALDRARSSLAAQGWNGRNYNPGAKSSTSLLADELHTIIDGRIMPPPVRIAADKGIWQKYVEFEDDLGRPAMQLISKKSSTTLHPKYKYYDRENKRCLFFEHRLQTPANYQADPEIFGYPIEMVFYEKVNHQFYERRKRSLWCYSQERPASKDALLVANQDHFDEYRRCHAKVTGSLSQQRLESEDDMDDIVSLGSDSDDIYFYTRDAKHNLSLDTLATGPVPLPLSTNYDRDRDYHSGSLRLALTPLSPGIEDKSCARPYAPVAKRSRSGSGGQSYIKKPRHSLELRSPQSPLSPGPYQRGMDDATQASTSPRSQALASSLVGSHAQLRSLPLIDAMPEDLNCLPSAAYQLPSGLPSMAVPVAAPASICSLSSETSPATVDSHLAHQSLPASRQPSEPFPAEAGVIKNTSTRHPTLKSTATHIPSSMNAIGDTNHSKDDSNIKTHFLILWNLPNCGTWGDAMDFIKEFQKEAPFSVIKKILRTNENGLQVFWLVFGDPHCAVAFHKALKKADNRNSYCSAFVLPNEYCAASARSTDAWNSTDGFEQIDDINAAFSDKLVRPGRPCKSLAIKLGMPISEPQKHKRRGGKKRTKKLGDNNGGAL